MEPGSSPECILTSESKDDALLIKVVVIKQVNPPTRVKIMLHFKGNLLGCSPPIDILETRKTAVNWEINYVIKQPFKLSIADLTANPFLLLKQDLLLDSDAEKLEEVKKQGTSKKTAKSKSTSNKSKLAVDSEASTNKKNTKLNAQKGKIAPQDVDVSESFETLGLCNLDIFPLLQGMEMIEEVLLVHPTVDQKGSYSVAWTNLPTIEVIVMPVGNFVRNLQDNFVNVLFFTLESVCNITPDFTANTQVATVFPTGEEFEVVKFMEGTLFTDTCTWFSKRKKWDCLSSIVGQGGLSLYKLNDENRFELKNTTECHVTAEDVESVPRVQWLQLFRRCFSDESLRVFKDKLVTFRCWPVEVLISKSIGKEHEYSETKIGKTVSKGSPEKEEKKGQKIEEGSNNHYVAFVDLSSLLYPGVTSTRVVSQLFSYTEDTIKNRFGTELCIFGTPKPKNEPVSKSVKSGKDKKEKSTLSKKNAKEGKQPEPVTEEIISTPVEPEPLFNAFGDPVFVVIQAELLKPLVEKKPSNDIIKSIQEVVPPRQLPTTEEIAMFDANSAFESCIERLIHNVHEEYELFYTTHEKLTNEKSCKYFFMHLHMTGAYTKMKETMKEYLEPYVYAVLETPAELSKMQAADQVLLTLNYTVLVDKVIRIVDCLASYSPGEYDSQVSTDSLLYFAVEAMEEGDFDKAQEYLLERLEKSMKAEPKYWLDYAVYWVKKFEFEKAGECVREAIALNTTYTPSLFFIGLLSWLTEDFQVAEMFLLAAVTTDPFFLEGWIALHIFHKQMNNISDATEELLNGKKCISKLYPFYPTPSFPTLSWCFDMSDRERIYLLTAAYMIKLSFPELAELALSYDLLLHGRSVSYLYLLAVCHYHQGRYKDSIQHLEEASRVIWEDSRVWSLKGHCYYKLHLFDEAKKALEFAVNCSYFLEDKHLVNLRLGKIVISEGDQNTAISCLVDICDQSPTPLSWLELGIAAYMDDNMKDAELALSEANMLDPRMARTWGYLALVNLMMTKYPIYHRCLNQAIKFGLDDPILLERLKLLGSLTQPLSDD